MLGVYWLEWWYGRGWQEVWHRLTQQFNRVWSAFSVGMLLKTLFKPWRQIVQSRVQGSAMQERTQRVVANLVSRLVGLMVRLFTLVGAVLISIILGVVGVALYILWPLIPLLSLVLIAKGLGLL